MARGGELLVVRGGVWGAAVVGLGGEGSGLARARLERGRGGSGVSGEQREAPVMKLARARG